MSDETKVTQEYGGSQIQVLEGLEAVRKRPGMYIGSTSSSGLHHLVYEIVDNAIDEALAGYCKHITVTINPGDSITVTDDGRGIPVDIQPQTGRPAMEVVFTVLHAGGKFGGGGYKVSGGLHGVGASVVNALSEWMQVRVYKNGLIHEMKFARGAITQEMKIVGKTEKTGTEVTFQPDPEMFDSLVYEIVDNSIDEALAGYCKNISVTINPGNSITVTDDGRGIPVDIQAQTGRPALEVVYTVLHAGGKFGGGGYKVSGGLHGVGASVVNALSEWLKVRVHKNGNIYEMKFARGHITQEMTIVGKTDKTGTEVTFQPDPEMFDTTE